MFNKIVCPVIFKDPLPVSTSITTHPISELDFPTVTVCPPKGSNTALNYDLMKADNNSLTVENRKDLKKTLYNIMIETPHKEFMKSIVAAVNPGNIELVFKGFQSIPKPFLQTGFETRMWNNYGEIASPWYNQSYVKGFHKIDRYYKVVLEFPEDLKYLVNSGSLLVQVEVDTRDEEGWNEYVEFSKGPKMKYKAYTALKTWSEAEAHCQAEGGHLASVLSEEEKQQMKEVAGHNDFWLGGRKQHEGTWKWADGASWGYTDWAYNKGNRGDNRNCLVLAWGMWTDQDCKTQTPFICQASPIMIKGNKVITLGFKRNELNFPSFEVWHNYQFTNQTLLDSWEDKRMTGFKISWRIEPPPLEMTSSEIGISVQIPGYGDNIHKTLYMRDRAFKVILSFPTGITENVVVQLQVDIRNEEGWEEYVTSNMGGPKKYNLVLEKRPGLKQNPTARDWVVTWPLF